MKLSSSIQKYFALRPLGAAFFFTLAASVSAAPGELSDVPLYSRGSAQPNIMFVLDSSGSMNTLLLPAEGYNSRDPVSFDCRYPVNKTYIWYRQGRRQRGNYDEVEYRVKVSDGSVEFRQVDNDWPYTEGIWRTWNNNDSCFNDTKKYTAWLFAGSGGESDTFYDVGSRSNDFKKTEQTGHFLNWFFSQKKERGGYEAAKFLDKQGKARRSKVDIRRTDAMKTAAKDLVSQLEGVRIGLMQFEDADAHGGKLLLGLTSLSSDNKSQILNKIDQIGASGSTPLAETFAGVGRYFIAGHETNSLTYKNENGEEAQAGGSTIFTGSSSDHPVLDWNGVTAPDASVKHGAIQYYCQKSFMVALTDGSPHNDNEVSPILRGFDSSAKGCRSNPGGCTPAKMDDVIRALYDIDLRPDLIKPNGEAEINNITSYLIGFANRELSNTDVMTNSGALGKGGTGEVYSADNAEELQLTFNQIFKDVQSITGSSGSIAFSSTVLDTGSALFAAQFHSGNWSGKLSAFSLDASGNIATEASWEAGSILDASTSPGSRVMLTYTGGKGVPFTAAGAGASENGHTKDLSLNSYIARSENDGRISERIAFLRGDRTGEGKGEGDFRERDSRLGDIVNSTPVYVGAPNASWSSAIFDEAKQYAKFKKDYKTRTPVVYVGANDGFLHGFNANLDIANSSHAGKEVIAYSPSMLLSTINDEGLHVLTSQYYNHKFYVDGTPTVSDVYINSQWQTVLVGGLRSGGKGYFALNVTNPLTFTQENAENIVLWEFSDSDNENLGYSFSRPQIGRMPNGEWAAIFGNGYNSTTGDAGIFIVYLDGSDSLNNKYVYLSTGRGSADNKNGMSTPAIIDADLDGTIDRIYAGDLQGNMWAFDVSAESSGSWSVVGGRKSPKPLFTVTGEAITAAPLVARNQNKTASPGLLVTFGTGQYLVAADTADTDAGGFYAVADNGVYGLTRNSLAERALSPETLSTGERRRKLDGEEVDWEDQSGWYISLQDGNNDIGDGGERVITRPSLLGHVLFFNTMIPSGQVCSAGGSGWLMSVDVWGGLAPKRPVFDGDNDGEINKSDTGYVGEYIDTGIPNGSGFIGDKQITPLSTADTNNRDVKPFGGGRIGRLSWEEITPF
ncbi:PilC/PilY family type IV pilus protein [uncultured Microbulbifer sp.]|uniref:pilus assembly protein n=1 Tax=uncultured Microbulbifer sp. TaxID=348147 RepID=UPI002634EB20|nr:PilC/PilY family type IV pilus protein [uncultured Microbulbifer sp.]